MVLIEYHIDYKVNERSNGQSFNNIDGISLRDKFYHQDKRVSQSHQNKEEIKMLQPFSSILDVQTYLLLRVSSANVQGMGKSAIHILIISRLEASKSIEEGILTILISKAEIFFDFTEQKFIILFQFIQRLTNINRSSHRYRLRGSMGDHLSPVPSS